VRNEFGFRDQVPFGYRDMGINDEIFQPGPGEKNKEYDFVFSGSVSRNSKMEKLLDQFSKGSMKSKKILVLSRDYQKIMQKYSSSANIIFKGPLNQQEVAEHLRRSSFALDIKALIEPYNHQTSTKFLEYLACRVPAISTDTPWLRSFQSRYGGQYFYLKDDLSNFRWEEISRFQYHFPNLKDWSWREQIVKSGVLDFLKKKFPSINWSALSP
jgi:glycosyltransferase involved in cell wall biosynthesis